MKWITADLHLGHENILKYCSRPFKTVNDMDRAIITNWNDMVGRDDIVYVVGDFTLGGLQIARRYFSQLAGYIHIIPGGHDRRWIDDMYRKGNTVTSASGYVVMIHQQIVLLKQPSLVVLSHHSMRVWPHSHRGAVNLFGHSHGALPPWPNSLDVGVDGNNMHPWQLEDAIDAARATGHVKRNCPSPHSGQEEVIPQLLHDIQERAALGSDKYGGPLLTHDGQDSLQDAHHRLMDVLMYLQKKMMEEGNGMAN